MCLRPSGVFYCMQYSSSSKWEATSSGITIDWKNYGQYELNIAGANELVGCQKGKPANWRKMNFLRPFNECETAMMGGGGGSVWNFEWEGGSFEVEFRCDGFNHFVCNTYPAHSHWSMEDNKILVDWDKYGKNNSYSFFDTLLIISQLIFKLLRIEISHSEILQLKL